MNLFPIILHLHSGIRWLVLAVLLLSIINALAKRSKGLEQTNFNCGINRLALIIVHLQFLFGLILYFISPKVIFAASSMKEPVLRFFLVEHLLLMTASVVLVTIGFVRFDRAQDIRKKYRNILIYYSIALFLILVSIPWPFLRYGGNWF